MYLNLTQLNPIPALICANLRNIQDRAGSRRSARARGLKSGIIIRNDTITDTVISVSEIVSSNIFQNAVEDQKLKG